MSRDIPIPRVISWTGGASPVGEYGCIIVELEGQAKVEYVPRWGGADLRAALARCRGGAAAELVRLVALINSETE